MRVPFMNTAITQPTLPKGGGAVQGIGEKFSTQLATGTSTVSIPIFASPGREHFGPQMELGYDSSHGNGPFGLGWDLSVPQIKRKTAKGLPQYRDAENSDTFLLSGFEDLVPVIGGSFEADGYTVQLYKPRIEGAFARIEKWQNQTTGEQYWQMVSKNNVTSVFGKSAAARIADPLNPAHVFAWLLEETADDKGNLVRYEYKQENGQQIDPSHVFERPRLTEQTSFANRYLKNIYYGNQQQNVAGNWLFQIVFDYGEHDPENPTVAETREWACRKDPFSSYRAGFEIRTYRLCQRVLMFHLMPEIGSTPCLVHSTDWTYQQQETVTLLTSATQTGWLRNQQTGAYATKSLPPLTFSYAEQVFQDTVQTLADDSLDDLPAGVDGTKYQFVDLDSEGIAGILSEQDGSLFYKRNLGGGRFALAQPLTTQPSTVNLSGGRQQIMDLANDGEKSLVQFRGATAGFYDREQEGQWETFVPFASLPKLAWDDPNLRFIDLNGDGYADILITEQDDFVWYPSEAKNGFGAARTVFQGDEEERGPRLVFADPTQSIFLADMTGDGLTDIVRIRNGEVCYWPNIGYGRFGSKINLANAPVFDYFDLFDQKRIRLADLNGSGTTDVLYIGDEGIRIWTNQAGNSLSEPYTLPSFPQADNLSTVMAVDLLGTGTGCLVWSSKLPGDRMQNVQYVDLLGGQKPFLLTACLNNMGAEMRISYTTSTQFYLSDRAAGKPWVTKLPIPVHVVEKVEHIDHILGTCFTQQYKYHHGYYDGLEREFRGFGLVEQWDADQFAAIDALDQPPVYTKTWFHTGSVQDRAAIAKQFASEYYGGDAQAPELAPSTLPLDVSAEELQEACRALKGKILRQEMYGLDGTAPSVNPYQVTEHAYTLTRIQPVQPHHYAVFLVTERESLELHYERNPEDPRMQHQMTLEFDAFGQVTKSAQIGYPRRTPAFPEQAETKVLYTEHSFFNQANPTGWYCIGVPIASSTYELTGLPTAGDNRVYTAAAMLTAATTAASIPYEAAPTANVLQKRLLKSEWTAYVKSDQSGPLPQGQVQSPVLVYQTYSQVLTPGLLQQVFDQKVDPASDLLTAEGGYVAKGGVWWKPSERHSYDPNHFYQPVQVIDPFGAVTQIVYDAYSLQVQQVIGPAPLQNTVTVQIDYRTLAPALITDANGNRTAVRMDELGMVVAEAVMGKEGENVGDTLADPTSRIEYEMFNWMQNGQPNFVHKWHREQYGSANTRWQEQYVYADGAGHEVMTKAQAEPGLAPQRDANGQLLRDAQGNLILADTTPNVRWVGTGRTILNNKGNPVKKYEPYFSSTFAYETEQELVETGVTQVLHYDPLGRVIRTDHPNGTFSKVQFDPWQQSAWDENDTVKASAWYAKRLALDPSVPANAPEIRAAKLAAEADSTPLVTHFDALGRMCQKVEDNGAAGQYVTQILLDIEGHQLGVVDAAGTKLMQDRYDMLGQKLYLNSADAGEKWMLANVAGHPMRTWDSRGYQTRTTYDVLQRQQHLFVQLGSGKEWLAECLVYGEAVPDAAAKNLRGKLYQHYDGAGVVTDQQYDFAGHLISQSRQYTVQFNQQADWTVLVGATDPQAISALVAPLLETETFVTSRVYDALSRVTSITTPDQSVVLPKYNESNLLEQVDARLRGAATSTAFVTDIDYDAKGQRLSIVYGNGVQTRYTYDPLTLRLSGLQTIRSADRTMLQNLSYTFDPVGNLMQLQDAAQQTVFFNNAVVSPNGLYQYDPLYRLVLATGREQIGQHPNGQPDNTDLALQNLPNANNGQAMQNYQEQYQYDQVGNILQMIHQANGVTAWNRRYSYAANSNRLIATSLPGDPDNGPYSAAYRYDLNGNIIQMPSAAQMQWDVHDRLVEVDLGGGGTAYYLYDAEGNRVRKVVQRSTSWTEERRYLGPYEIYRKTTGGGLQTERQTLHLMDDVKRIAMVETLTTDNGQAVSAPTPRMRYQLSNHLGSSCLELDETGAIITYEEYYPFGGSSYRAAASSIEVSEKRYRYTGKERDEETGLYYYGARYYAAWLGRWMSCDKVFLSDPLKEKPYVYVENRPLIAVDPDGNVLKLLFEVYQTVRNSSAASSGRRFVNNTFNWQLLTNQGTQRVRNTTVRRTGNNGGAVTTTPVQTTRPVQQQTAPPRRNEGLLNIFRLAYNRNGSILPIYVPGVGRNTNLMGNLPIYNYLLGNSTRRAFGTLNTPQSPSQPPPPPPPQPPSEKDRILSGLNVRNVVEKTAEEVNQWWKTSMGYKNSPYKDGTKAYEVELAEDTTFTRVFDGNTSGKFGGWLMKSADITGLTPEEIREKYALPQVPKFAVDVQLKAGDKLRFGIAGPVTDHDTKEFWGNGSGIQGDLMGQRIGNFVNVRDLK